MVTDDGKSILMDFGSACQARIEIHSRQEALKQQVQRTYERRGNMITYNTCAQDIAAEHCSMPYRAPELFDVKTETVLDEKVDIWSLGCTLYAMAYGQSPFEVSLNDQGGSIALAVLNGQFKFPSDNRYSKEFQDLISWMLQVDPKSRPDIQQVKQDLNDKKRRERKITKCSGVTDLGTSRLAFEQGRCIFFIEKKKRELYFYDVQLVSKRISHFLFVSGCTYNLQYTHAHTAQTRSLPLSLSPFVSFTLLCI